MLRFPATILFIFLITFPLQAQETNPPKLEYQLQLSVYQNFLDSQVPGAGSTTVDRNFNEFFALPKLTAGIVYALNPSFEVQLNGSFTVFGGKFNDEESGITYREEFYAAGLGLAVSYLVHPKVHLTAFADHNFIFKVNERTENPVISSLNRDVSDRFINNAIRPGFKVSYFISDFYVAAEYSFIPTNLYEQEGDFANAEKFHQSVGIAVGYRFR